MRRNVKANLSERPLAGRGLHSWFVYFTCDSVSPSNVHLVLTTLRVLDMRTQPEDGRCRDVPKNAESATRAAISRPVCSSSGAHDWWKWVVISEGRRAAIARNNGRETRKAKAITSKNASLFGRPHILDSEVRVVLPGVTTRRRVSRESRKVAPVGDISRVALILIEQREAGKKAAWKARQSRTLLSKSKVADTETGFLLESFLETQHLHLPPSSHPSWAGVLRAEGSALAKGGGIPLTLRGVRPLGRHPSSREGVFADKAPSATRTACRDVGCLSVEVVGLEGCPAL